MNLGTETIWFIICVTAIGTYLIRFSFIGFIGTRKLPEWLLRLLRYTPVAVLPGLIAPLVVWPAATGGNPDPARLSAAAAAVVAGMATRNVLAGIATGGVVLFAMLRWFGT